MKYLFPDENIALIAPLTVTDDTVVPSTAIARTDTNENAGTADVEVTGPYEGQHDTSIDIQVLDGDGDSSQTSQPVLIGIGTGTLDDLAVTSLPAQGVSITLTDVGTPTQTAQAPFQGQILLAAAPGPDGNLISIAVDPAALDVSTTPIGTLHAQINSGTSVYSGPSYDGFGAVALNADGTIPDGTNGTTPAPRVRIGHDPTVFRLAKKFNFTTNAFDFIFSPTPVRDIDAGANVYSVSGTWGFAILVNGVVMETYTGDVTLYDALLAINAGSTIVVLAAPPLNDKTPNGQGIVDLSVWTRPYIIQETSSGTDFVKNADFAFGIDATAPTAAVGFTCIDDSILGAEIFQVIDGVNIGLPNATTGVPYIGGPYSALIPIQTPQSGSPNGNIDVQFNFQPRAEDVPQPSGRLVTYTLGARAQNASYTFTLVKKPSPDCDEDHPTGEARFACLGIEPVGGGTMTEARTIARQQMLAAAVRDIVGSNTPSNPSLSPFYVEGFDVDTVIATAGELQSCVIALEAAATNDVWTAAATIGVDEVRESVNRNGYRFRAVVGGITGGSEPSWDTTIGEETTDNTVTWLNVGRVFYDMFDLVFGQWYAEMKALAGFEKAPTFLVRANSTDYFYGQTIIPATRNGHAYAVGKPGTSGGSAPTFKTDGSAFADGTAILIDLGPYWTPGAFAFQISRIVPGNGFVYNGSAGNFFTGATEPDWSTAVTEGATLSDGTQTWNASRRATNTSEDTTAEYLQRWSSATADVLAAAGITPTFKSASVNGDGCWQDFDDNANWFKNTDGPLLPFQQGHGYNAESLQLDPETGQLVPTTTEEFFIKIAFRCDLAIGDSFTVNVSGVSGGPKAYQVGDNQTFAVVHADPLQFGGGQNGTDFHTWTINADSTFAPYYQLLTTPANRQNSHAYIVGDKYKPVTPNLHWYMCAIAGTSAGSPPTFHLDGTTFADGTATFQDMGLIDGYANNGLTFDIHEGGIGFGLGDAWTFRIEGGHFRWRRDGGAWSGSTVIATTDLGDGLSLTFDGGVSPSYVAGDAWSFAAYAVNGPDQMKAPTDGRFSWIGTTTIAIASSGTADGILIGDHTIPSTATIVLQGSNDSFSHTVVNQTLAWKERNIAASFIATTAAAWRLVVTMAAPTDPGSIFWLCLTQAQTMKLWNGKNDVGALTKNYRLPDGIGTRDGIGYEIVHSFIGKTSLDQFRKSLNIACANYSGRFGVVPNDLEDEAGIVEADAASLQIKEVKDYMPRDITTAQGQRRHNFTLTVNPLQ